jgi:hypothetical protein
MREWMYRSTSVVTVKYSKTADLVGVFFAIAKGILDFKLPN